MKWVSAEFDDFKESWVELDKREKFACINLILILLFNHHWYLTWFLSGEIYKVFFLFTTSLSLLLLNISVEMSTYIQRVVLLFVLFIIYFTLPVFGHSFSLGQFVGDVLLLLCIFYHEQIYKDTYKLLRQVMFVVCVSSIIMWIIHFWGGDLPNYHVTNFNWRERLTDSYKIYGTSVSMYFNNGFMNGIERCNGVFGEPGHFGIFLGFIIAANKFRFKNAHDYVFLIAGILTFSTAFFGILAIGFLYRIMNCQQSKKDLVVVTLAGCMALPVLLSNAGIYESLIGRVLKDRETISVNEMVEQRTLESTKLYYDNLMRTDQKWYGVGSTPSVTADSSTILQYTNWRGGVYRFGIIGMTILCLLICYMTVISDRKYAIMILAIMALIMSHRMYQVTTWGLLLLEFMAIQLNAIESDDDSELSESEAQTS